MNLRGFALVAMIASAVLELASCGGSNDSRSEAAAPSTLGWRQSKAPMHRGGVRGGGHDRQRQKTAPHHNEDRRTADAAALTVQIFCGSQLQSRSAREWRTADDPASIAHAFGLEYREPVRAAVEENCLRAFADSPSQWEAEVEAYGQL
jgi:hypothetical protein